MALRPLRIAVEGCGHGTLNAIYASIEKACEAKGWPGIDMLIIGGDFQAVRNIRDLNCMAVPGKYRQLGDFWEYYAGRRRAPYLTIFVGGNHEASNHLTELFYGGWVAPNIYYMGAANVLRFGGLRIAGLSGIWKGYDYRKPHTERLPYRDGDERSAFHVREIDTRRLLQIKTQVDVGISHDWPKDVQWAGNFKGLFQKKPDFKADADSGKLGSWAAKYVMDKLRPPYWFAAHLHVKFSAIIKHEARGGAEHNDILKDSNADSQKIEDGSNVANDLAIGGRAEGNGIQGTSEVSNHLQSSDINIKITSESAAQATPILTSIDPETSASSSLGSHAVRDRLIDNDTTRFLALDKCLPKRGFLQLLEIAPNAAVDPASEPSSFAGEPRLCYDPEWLAITRVFADEIKIGPQPESDETTDLGHDLYTSWIQAELEWVNERVVRAGKLAVPDNFEVTAPVQYNPREKPNGRDLPREYKSPQTATFCNLVGIVNPLD